MSYFFGSKKSKKTDQEDWEEVIIDKKDIQTILSNQEKAYPNRIKTLKNLETIIENQEIILGYIDTMTKKMNDMERRINKPSGMFSSYLSPSIFPNLDTDTEANSIRQENIIKRKTPKAVVTNKKII